MNATSNSTGSNGGPSPQEVGAIAVDQLVEAMLKAVQARGDGRSPAGRTAALTPEARDALFGYEVLSAWTGRLGSEREPFQDRLAEVLREPGRRLTVKKPAHLECAAVAEVRSTTGKEETVPVDDGRAVLKEIEDCEEITGVVLRDLDGRPLALAGRLRPLPQQNVPVTGRK